MKPRRAPPRSLLNRSNHGHWERGRWNRGRSAPHRTPGRARAGRPRPSRRTLPRRDRRRPSDPGRAPGPASARTTGSVTPLLTPGRFRHLSCAWLLPFLVRLKIASKTNNLRRLPTLRRCTSLSQATCHVGVGPRLHHMDSWKPLTVPRFKWMSGQSSGSRDGTACRKRLSRRIEVLSDWVYFRLT